MKRYYIAYGSNLSVSQMKDRCPDATPVGTSTLKDWELVFRYHATIEPRKGASVPVVIWDISSMDEHRLDKYEGYPHYYIKRYITLPIIDIRTNRRRTIRAMVYVMVGGQSPITPPSDVYYNVIMDGYRHFGLNEAFLRKAFNDSIYQYVTDNEIAF